MPKISIKYISFIIKNIITKYQVKVITKKNPVSIKSNYLKIK